MLRATLLLIFLCAFGVRGDTECAPQRSITRLMRGSFAPGVGAADSSLAFTPYEYGSTFEAGTATQLSHIFVYGSYDASTVWTVWSAAGDSLRTFTLLPATGHNYATLEPAIALEPGARFTVSASGAARTQIAFASESPLDRVFNPTVASLATYIGSFRSSVFGTPPQDPLADPLTVLGIDVGLVGCVVQPTIDAPSGRATLRVDAVTYPPGLCGFTHACRVDAGKVYRGPVGEVCTAPESACDFVDPTSTCVQQLGFNVTRQLTCGTRGCVHPCLTGPLCTTFVKPLNGTGPDTACYADNPILAPCRNFGPLGCNSTSLTCVRQTFTGTRAVRGAYGVSVALPAMDVCCPRGFNGDDCKNPVGCTVDQCDNGGVCVNIERPQDSYCAQCPIGSVNATALTPGWVGAFCEVRKLGAGSFVRVRLASAPARRRLLSATAVTVPGPNKVYRACDCGSTWATAGTPVTTTGTEHCSLSGNHGRTPAAMDSALLSLTGFAVGDMIHAPTLARPVGSVEQARYLCSVDFYCTGFFHSATTQRAYFTQAPTSTSAPCSSVLSDFTDVRYYALDRTARRVRCLGGTALDPEYYMRWYGAEVIAAVSGATVGQIDMPPDAANASKAELHWRVFGHLQQLRPNAGCDASVDVNQDTANCTWPLDIDAEQASNGFVVERFTNTTVVSSSVIVCDGAGVQAATTTIVATPVVTITDQGTVEQIVLAPITTVVETVGACTVAGTTYATSTVIEQDTTVGLSLNGTCAPVELVPATRFSPALVVPTTRRSTGVKNYGSTQSYCECSVPFHESQANRTDCASAERCTSHGAVNLAWFEAATHATPASPDACICLAPYTTDPASCTTSSCAWCQTTLCENYGQPVLPVGDEPARCSCTGICAGPTCAESLCSPEGTRALVNHTASDGSVQIRCDCKGSYYGQYCDTLCVDGDYDDTQRACICNRRAGVRGAACNEPICAGNGAGKWVNGDPLDTRPLER
ncbi:MAG: hypothetical protein Q7V62_05845, partial [Actinomycetota bacterium]|nr:hypothetical protein [Actinomycetota bacterium]